MTVWITRATQDGELKDLSELGRDERWGHLGGASLPARSRRVGTTARHFDAKEDPLEGPEWEKMSPRRESKRYWVDRAFRI